MTRSPGSETRSFSIPVHMIVSGLAHSRAEHCLWITAQTSVLAYACYSIQCSALHIATDGVAANVFDLLASLSSSAGGGHCRARGQERSHGGLPGLASGVAIMG